MTSLTASSLTSLVYFLYVLFAYNKNLFHVIYNTNALVSFFFQTKPFCYFFELLNGLSKKPMSVEQRKLYIDDKINQYFHGALLQATLLAPLLWLVSTIFEYFYSPSNFRQFIVPRIFIMVFLLLIYLVTKKAKQYIWNYLLAYLAILASICTIEYLILHTGGHTSEYYVSVILLSVYIHGLIPTRFSFHLLSAGMIYGVYLAGIIMAGAIVNVEYFAIANFFILSIMSVALLYNFLHQKRLYDELSTQYDLKVERLKLEESEKRYRSLYTSTPVMLLTIDQKGKIQTMSDIWLEEFGYKQHEVINRPFTDFLTDKSQQVAKNEMLPRLLTTGHCKDVPLQMRMSNGDIMDILISVSPEKTSKGTINYFVAALQDVTEKNRLENQLRQAQKMEALGVLAGGIAHDINNILAIIFGYTEMAMAMTQDGSQIKKNLGKVITAADRAKDLVKQILHFSRQVETKLVTVNPYITIKETLKLLRSTIPASIEIREDIDPKCGTITADPTQIHQILSNLASNAVHAMDEKGILNIRLKQIKVKVDDRLFQPEMSPGQYIKLSISDTGIGITPKIRNQIFDPFFTTKGIGEGTGMGLSVVHGIVQSHNGFINVDSEIGKGTNFDIYFPVTMREQTELNESEQSLPKGSERILLVDDEKELIDIEQLFLEHQGYKVATAASSFKALEIFTSSPEEFDLIISDQTMPQLTGVELARELLKIRANIPIIICTGYSSKISVDKISEYGISEILIKPYSKSKFAMTIRKVLDRA